MWLDPQRGVGRTIINSLHRHYSIHSVFRFNVFENQARTRHSTLLLRVERTVSYVVWTDTLKPWDVDVESEVQGDICSSSIFSQCLVREAVERQAVAENLGRSAPKQDHPQN